MIAATIISKKKKNMNDEMNSIISHKIMKNYISSNYIFSIFENYTMRIFFGADNDTSAPSIHFKLASPYFLHAIGNGVGVLSTQNCVFYFPPYYTH